LRYELDKMHKKPPTDPTKLPRTQEKFNTISVEYENLNRDLKAELLEFFLDRPNHFDNQFRLLMAFQSKIFSDGARAFNEYRAYIKPQSYYPPVQFSFDKTPPVADDANTTTTSTTTQNTTNNSRPVSTYNPVPTYTSTNTTNYNQAPPPTYTSNNTTYYEKQDTEPIDISFDPTAAIVHNKTVQQQTGRAVAGIAQNQQYQQQMGTGVANIAQSQAFQKQVGITMQSSNNQYVAALGKNEKVTQAVGTAVAVTATNKTVQQQVGNVVANTAQNEQFQQKVANSIAPPPTRPQRPTKPES